MLRHAIEAAEVAPICNRDPQVGDVALEWVDQHGFRSAGAWCFLRPTPLRILREGVEFLPENLGIIGVTSTVPLAR